VLLASLWWLEEHCDPPPTQARLAQHAGTDSMMTSQVIRKLEARGLLERALDPTDGRARQLGLTDAGRAIVTAALADVEATDDAYFASLGDSRPTFVDALRALDAAQIGEGAAPPDATKRAVEEVGNPRR
jgi:DNA-binding MarR family transcriptional regulator